MQNVPDDGFDTRPWLERLEKLYGGRCTWCDDTGDVHGLDGEWRGRCPCRAADKMDEKTILKGVLEALGWPAKGEAYSPEAWAEKIANEATAHREVQHLWRMFRQNTDDKLGVARDIDFLVRQLIEEAKCEQYNGWSRNKSSDELSNEISRKVHNLAMMKDTVDVMTLANAKRGVF